MRKNNIKISYECLELDKLYWFSGRKGTSETRENVFYNNDKPKSTFDSQL